MELVLAHRNMDFDCLASQIAVSKLNPAVCIVPAQPLSKRLKSFLALYRNKFPVVDLQYVDWHHVKHVYLVDCQKLDRLDDRAQRKFAEYRQRGGHFTIFDHHDSDKDSLLPFANDNSVVKICGSAASILTEILRERQIKLGAFEATVIAAGIYEDTGCLTHRGTTELDAQGIAYCLSQGADIERINEIIRPKFDERQAALFETLLSKLEIISTTGARFAVCCDRTAQYVDGLSEISSRILENSASDALVVVVEMKDRIHVVARSESAVFDLRGLARELGGGGHAGAISAVVKGANLQEVKQRVIQALHSYAKSEKTAAEVMATPVRTIRSDISMDEAGRIMLRHFQDGLVVMENEVIVGVVSQRDVDKARHHKLGHASVKGFMSHPVYTVSEHSPLSEIQSIMVAHDIGRLPVLDKDGRLLGIVGRRELLLALYGEDENAELKAGRIVPKLTITGTEALLERIDPQMLQLYRDVGEVAAELNMVAYLVGGCVRDLILDRPNYDIDIVVEGSARDLAQALASRFPNNYEIVVEHARFNTATLYVYDKPLAGSAGVLSDSKIAAATRREIDIATARTEYYEYPAALPTVEPSSLEQDLFRRDFTINALAMCLHPERLGEIIDYFSGIADLNSGTVRILHPFSFIEDPTRIVRSVRFAARLDFDIEGRTRIQAERAISLGIFDNLGGIRLKEELRYILESDKRLRALDLLHELGGGLRFIDADIKYDKKVRLHVRRAEKLISNFSQLKPFVVYLGVLCYALEERKLMEALRRLRLAEDECAWIRDAQIILRGLLELNPSAKRSELYEVLHGHNEHTLAIAASVAPMASNLRRSIRLYFEELKDVRSDFRGDDLIKMGIAPGPQIGLILQRLRNARLDRELNSYEDEKNYVLSNFRTQ